MTRVNSQSVVNGIFQELQWTGSSSGPLAGLTFAAKDLFAVKGYVTGAGSPEWLSTHHPEPSTAPAIQKLLDAGATHTAKTICDELAFSLDGINKHYGTPVNPQLPDCIPGGSSSGSASMVASSLVDFALGTDTAGSIRVPASYCGIFGFRPTHDAVVIKGVVPLSLSYDSVGWFARRADLLKTCGEILLQDFEKDKMPKHLFIAVEPLGLLDPALRESIDAAIGKIKTVLPQSEYKSLDSIGIDAWPKSYSQHKGWEVWQQHGQWIINTKPDFGKNIQANFDYARCVTLEESRAALAEIKSMKDAVNLLLNDNAVLCLPTAHALPPKKSATWDELAANRKNLIKFSCISPVGGLPEVTMPIAISDTISVGLSLIGARGSDMMLLDLACKLSEILYPTKAS